MRLMGYIKPIAIGTFLLAGAALVYNDRVLNKQKPITDTLPRVARWMDPADSLRADSLKKAMGNLHVGANADLLNGEANSGSTQAASRDTSLVEVIKNIYIQRAEKIISACDGYFYMLGEVGGDRELEANLREIQIAAIGIKTRLGAISEFATEKEREVAVRAEKAKLDSLEQQIKIENEKKRKDVLAKVSEGIDSLSNELEELKLLGQKAENSAGERYGNPDSTGQTQQSEENPDSTADAGTRGSQEPIKFSSSPKTQGEPDGGQPPQASGEQAIAPVEEEQPVQSTSNAADTSGMLDNVCYLKSVSYPANDLQPRLNQLLGSLNYSTSMINEVLTEGDLLQIIKTNGLNMAVSDIITLIWYEYDMYGTPMDESFGSVPKDKMCEVAVKLCTNGYADANEARAIIEKIKAAESDNNELLNEFAMKLNDAIKAGNKENGFDDYSRTTIYEVSLELDKELHGFQLELPSPSNSGSVEN